MTDEEKKSLGIFYTVDKERKVIIYDTSCNNHGKLEYSIKDTTKNMAEIAAKENMPVETEIKVKAKSKQEPNEIKGLVTT